MVEVSNTKDLASLRQVFLILQQVLENPDKFEVINFETELGTSRAELPSVEHKESAAQRIGISLYFVEKPNNG